MDINYSQPLSKNSYTILRAAGYVPIRDRKTGKESYVLKLRETHYPRFHLYIEREDKEEIAWHLHFDQKEHGWGEKRHDAQYDGEDVEKEVARLQRWLVHFTASSKDEDGPKDDKDKSVGGFFAKLFG